MSELCDCMWVEDNKCSVGLACKETCALKSIPAKCSNCGSSELFPGQSSFYHCKLRGGLVGAKDCCDKHTRTVQPLAGASAGVPFIVSADDVVRFNKTQLGRAKANLENALARGDKKAADNIQRKIAIYEYTIQYMFEHET